MEENQILTNEEFNDLATQVMLKLLGNYTVTGATGPKELAKLAIKITAELDTELAQLYRDSELGC